LSSDKKDYITCFRLKNGSGTDWNHFKLLAIRSVLQRIKCFAQDIL